MLARAIQAVARPFAAGVASLGIASTFCAGPCDRVTICGKEVDVTGEPDVDVCVATRSIPFLDWVEALETKASDDTSSFEVDSVHIQSVDLFGHPPRQRVGFVKLIADVKVDGHPAPGICFLRGGAIAVLVILQCEGKDFVVLVRQPRVPIGSSGFDEIPAGMLDGEGHFAGVAAKELQEEIGLEIRSEDLVDLTQAVFGDTPLSRPTHPVGHGSSQQHSASGSGSSWQGDDHEAGVGTARGLYPSPGGCDEFLRLYVCKKRVSSNHLAEMQARIHGEASERERIAVRVVPLEDVWRRTPDAKTLSTVLLYEKLRDTGSLPRA